MRSDRAPAGKAGQLTDLAIILDCSGSMSEKTTDGQTKMKVAKEVVTELVRKLPDGLNVTFLVYGHDAALKCQAVKVVRPLGRLDSQGKAELTRFIATLEPAGHTPIALALQTAGKELAKKSDASCGLVLITDGMETCHGNPAEEAARLARTLNLTFGANVIGFDVNDPKERRAVEEIARAGKGTYYNADSAAKLTAIVQRLGEEVVKKADPAPAPRGDRPVDFAGKDSKPGAFVNDAPVVGPGEYKGTLPLMGADYRQVAVRKGQELRVIGIVQKTPYQASNSVINETFSITVYDSNLTVVAREQANVVGNPSALNTFRATWTAPADGMAYVAISASDNHDGRGGPIALYGDLNPKPSPYTLTIKVAGEAAEGGAPQAVAPSGAKAGNGFAQAGEMTVPSLAGADLKLGEVVFYRLKVKKGEAVQASAAFAKPWYQAGNSNIKTTYTLTLYDDDQVQVAQKKVEVELNPPDARTLTISAPVQMSGSAYLSVSCENSGADVYPEGFKPKPGRVAVQVTGATTGTAADPFKGTKADGK
jgi:hypothetical protein